MFLPELPTKPKILLHANGHSNSTSSSLKMCSREEIIEDLWNSSLYIDENTLYVNVNRLRDKLKRLGADGFIRTVRGVGYRL